MIKLKSFIKEGGKLFGDKSQRVTTDEMIKIFHELKEKVTPYFKKMELSKSLPEKTTHGDVDIIALPIGDWKNNLIKTLGHDIIERSHNGGVHSFLINFSSIHKHVHVDFIIAGTEESFQSKYQYFQFNDLSGIIGVFSKKLYFKYGSDGIFKRYRDNKGNWHDILISHDLDIGLRILGLDPHKKDKIETVDDIVDFVISSPFMDSTYYHHDNLVQSDRKSEKRPVILYVDNAIRDLNIYRKNDDDDYFLKKYFHDKYQLVLNKIKEFDEYIAPKSKYDGNWLIRNFNLKPSPLIGRVLQQLYKIYSDKLENTSEVEVKHVVNRLLKMEKTK